MNVPTAAYLRVFAALSLRVSAVVRSGTPRLADSDFRLQTSDLRPQTSDSGGLPSPFIPHPCISGSAPIRSIRDNPRFIPVLSYTLHPTPYLFPGTGLSLSKLSRPRRAEPRSFVR